MTPTPETTRITATVTLDICPQEGQSPGAAADHFAKVFREYLEHRDFPFWEDYGADLDDIAESRSGADDAPDVSWGGYEGPFVTSVLVRDDDAVDVRAEALARAVGADPSDPAAYRTALEQARRDWDEGRAVTYPHIFR